MSPFLIPSENELYSYIAKYPEVYLFFGFGARAQYDNVEAVLSHLSPCLQGIEARNKSKWLAIYGGDVAKEDAPDLGWLMKWVQEKYNCDVLSIQFPGVTNPHVDAIFEYEPQYEDNGKGGRSKLYGGLRLGEPVGGTRYYLGRHILEKRSNGKPLLDGIFVAGGGGIAVEEIQYAHSKGVAWVYIPSVARNKEAYPTNSIFGPVHDWVTKSMVDSAHSMSFNVK